MKHSSCLLGFAVVFAAVLAVLPCCKSADMNTAAADLSKQIDELLGKATSPGQHLLAIAECNDESDGWKFRPEAPDAFERTREAVRGLAICDYARWGETAYAVQTLATMSEVHPSGLVRAECLDTLASIGALTIAALPEATLVQSESDVFAGLAVIRDSGTFDRDDPASGAALADAINTLAAFRFDAAKAPPPTAEVRAVARVLRSQFASCRTVLRALNSDTISGYETDPRVRDALDRAWMSCSASAVRAALLASAVSDPLEITRTAAVRALGAVLPEIGADVLGFALRGDLASGVRREAARSLGNYPAATAVPALLSGLVDDVAEVRSNVVQSLVAVTGEDFGDHRGAWLRWWKARGTSGETRPAASAPPSSLDRSSDVK